MSLFRQPRNVLAVAFACVIAFMGIGLVDPILKPIADDLGITMAQLAVAWVLANPNVAGAIIGASRPEQIAENVKASGVEIPAELMARIDEALGDVVERDPSKTRAPETRQS